MCWWQGGVLEHQALMVHHTSPRFSWSRGWTTFGYSLSSDQTTHYNIWSSSWHACQLNNRPTIEDNQVVERPNQQLTMIWTHRWLGRASLSIRFNNIHLVDSILTVYGYMWTIYFGFYGRWLDIEVVKSRPLGSISLWILCNRSCR